MGIENHPIAKAIAEEVTAEALNLLAELRTIKRREAKVRELCELWNKRFAGETGYLSGLHAAGAKVLAILDGEGE